MAQLLKCYNPNRILLVKTSIGARTPNYKNQ